MHKQYSKRTQPVQNTVFMCLPLEVAAYFQCLNVWCINIHFLLWSYGSTLPYHFCAHVGTFFPLLQLKKKTKKKHTHQWYFITLNITLKYKVNKKQENTI